MSSSYPIHLLSFSHGTLTDETLEEYNNSRLEGFLCDASIKSCDGKAFKVHRILTAAASPYLESIFDSGTTAEVELENQFATAQAVENVIHWIYKAETILNNEKDAVETLATGRLLQLLGFGEECLKRVVSTLTHDNVLDIWAVANSLESPLVGDVVQECRTFVCRNFQEMVSDHGLARAVMDLSKDDFLSLLAHDELSCNEEDEVWVAIRTWIEHDPAERSRHLMALVETVRMALVRLPTILEIAQRLKDKAHLPEFRGAVAKETCFLMKNLEAFKRGLLPAPDRRLVRPRFPKKLILVVVSEATNWNPKTNETTFYSYDLHADSWQRLDCKLPPNICSVSATLFNDKEVAFVSREDFPRRIAVHSFDFSNMTCRELSTLDLDRTNNAFTPQLVVYKGKLTACISNALMEVYDEETNHWERRDLVVRDGDDGLLLGPSFGTASGRLYCVGGFGSDVNETLGKIRCLDEEKNSFERIARLQNINVTAQCCEMNGKLLVAGGFRSDREDVYGRMEQFDPATGEVTPLFTESPSSPETDFDFHVIQMGNGVLAVEGDRFAFWTRILRTNYYEPCGRSWKKRRHLLFDTDIRVRGIIALNTSLILDNYRDVFFVKDRVQAALERLEGEVVRTEREEGIYDISTLFESSDQAAAVYPDG